MLLKEHGHQGVAIRLGRNMTGDRLELQEILRGGPGRGVAEPLEEMLGFPCRHLGFGGELPLDGIQMVHADQLVEVDQVLGGHQGDGLA